MMPLHLFLHHSYSAPSSVGQFEPARLRGLVTSSSGHRQSSALCAKWTTSHHARSSSSPLTGGRMRRLSNFPEAPYHWLGFLGCHSRPKEVLPPGRTKGPGQGGG